MIYRNGFSILFVLATAGVWGCDHVRKTESDEGSDDSSGEGTDSVTEFEDDTEFDPPGRSESESDSEGSGDESGVASEGDSDSSGIGAAPERDSESDTWEGLDGDSGEAEATDQETLPNVCGYHGPLSPLDAESCLYGVPLSRLLDFDLVIVDVNNRTIGYDEECRIGIGWAVGKYPNTIRLCDQICADLQAMADAGLTLNEGCINPVSY